MNDKHAVTWLSKTAGRYKWNIMLLALLQMLVNGGAVCYALVMKKNGGFSRRTGQGRLFQRACYLGTFNAVAHGGPYGAQAIGRSKQKQYGEQL